MTALLIVLAVGFAWSIGAHYTGAVMGLPHALRAIGAWQALLLMAPLAFLGATFASHEVEKRVGSGLTDGRLSVSQQVVVIGVAFAVTTFFNRFRMPTSTIQILVFSVVGVALATGTGVSWSSIEHLVGVWAAVGTGILRRWPRVQVNRETERNQEQKKREQWGSGSATDLRVHFSPLSSRNR